MAVKTETEDMHSEHQSSYLLENQVSAQCEHIFSLPTWLVLHYNRAMQCSCSSKSHLIYRPTAILTVSVYVSVCVSVSVSISISVCVSVSVGVCVYVSVCVSVCVCVSISIYVSVSISVSVCVSVSLVSKQASTVVISSDKHCLSSFTALLCIY